MEDVLTTLNACLQQLTDIGNDIRREGRVYEEELADRLRLGLTGDDAIRHYNEWMEREGMPQMKVNATI